MIKVQNITEDQLDLMQIIEENGKVSQRLMSQITGFSIGKVNYCFKELKDIGFIKRRRCNNSNKKSDYLYILTQKGSQEKKAITKEFIIKKKKEYDKLKSYLNT